MSSVLNAPFLVFGRRQLAAETAELLRYGDNHEDDDQPILLLARTAELALAGVAGTVVFHRLFVAVTFTTPFALRLQPLVDGKGVEYADIEVTSADFADPDQNLTVGSRATYLFEVSLSVPYIRNNIERFRTGLIGCYFQVEVTQTLPLPEAGELILESLELEYEVVTQSSVQ